MHKYILDLEKEQSDQKNRRVRTERKMEFEVSCVTTNIPSCI